MKNIKSLFRIFSELSYILNKKQKMELIKVLVAVIISSFLELLGISAILPFVQIITDKDNAIRNEWALKVMDFGGLSDANQLLLLVGIGLIILYIFKNSFIILLCYVQFDYATRIQAELSQKMLRAYMSRPYIFFTKTSSAEIMRGCSQDVVGVYNVVANLIDSAAKVLAVFLIGIYMLWTDPQMTLTILVLMIIILVAIVIIYKPIMKKAGNENIICATQTGKVLYQSIQGIKEIMVMQRKSMFLSAYDKATNESRIVQRRYFTLNASPNRIIEAICISGIIGILCLRIFDADTDMSIFVPQLAAFAIGAFKVLPSIGDIASRVNTIVFYTPGVDNVYNNLKEINEKWLFNDRSDIEHNGEYNLPVRKDIFKDRISVEHLTWKYDESRESVLNDISISINKGEAVGLFGPSGSGKTTLSDIILGLFKPSKGQVKVDGIDIYSMQRSWANIISYVPQSVYIFSDSIKNNIAFGAEVDEEAVWDALERAQIDEFVRNLPEGLNTILGEGGIDISGGQKQRLAIARALYNKPELLVMDESTAALDNETEAAVMKSIENLKGNITLIIIAHRLSTIMQCDKVYEIKNNKAYLRDKSYLLDRMNSTFDSVKYD